MHKQLIAAFALVTFASCTCGDRFTNTTSTLAVEPSSLDFGDVPLGTPRTLDFKLRNSGTAPIAFAANTASGLNATEFALPELNGVELQASAEQSRTVQFTPTVEGDATVQLTLHSNANNSPEFVVFIHGRGVNASVDAGQPDAGPIDAGEADAGTIDAGVPDAGLIDAGVPDAGTIDAGIPDAGTIDAGVPDAGPSNWVKFFSGDLDDIGLAVAPGGDLAITTWLAGPTDFGLGTITPQSSRNCLLVRFDAAGTTRWNKLVAGSGVNECAPPALDAAGNVVLVGEFQSTITLAGSTKTAVAPVGVSGAYNLLFARFDADGGMDWIETFNSSGGTPRAVAVAATPAGDFFAVGSLGGGGINFGNGVTPGGNGVIVSSVQYSSGYLAHFTSTGTVLWTRSYGTGTPSSIALDVDGGPAIAGVFASTIDLGTGTLSQTAGTFVGQLTSTGPATFARAYAGGTLPEMNRLTVDRSGNVIFPPVLHAPADFGGGTLTPTSTNLTALVKLSATGSHVWSKTFSGQGGYVTQAVTDAAGNVLVSGSVTGNLNLGGGALTPSSGTQYWVAKFDPAGNHLWSRLFPVLWIGGIAFDANGAAYVAGLTRGTVDLGTGPLVCPTAGTPTCGFIMKL